MFQKLPLTVSIPRRSLGLQDLGVDKDSLVSQLLGSGQDGRRHVSVSCRINEETIYLQTVLLVVLFFQHMLVEVIVILKDIQLHLYRLGDADSLTGKGAFALHIIIDWGMQGIEYFRVTDIFQIEQKILTPVDIRIHSQTVLLHQIPAVQFVPQHTIVKVCRILHHMCRELLLGEHTLLFNVSLGGQTLSHHAVKV